MRWVSSATSRSWRRVPSLAEVYTDADLFALSSRWEGLPYVILEAMAYGLPVVATSVDGVPEAVEDGVTGVLVPPGDPKPLGREIVGLLRDKDERQAMGAAARTAVERFEVGKMVDKTVRLYRLILGLEEAPPLPEEDERSGCSDRGCRATGWRFVRRWADSTFIFISTNSRQEPGGVEERWLRVMKELVALGATVHYLCFKDSRTADDARELGVTVAPYLLDKWNVIRSRSRLRKYLRRYEPVCVHSTGLEADAVLRWAVRHVPDVEFCATLPATGVQGTRRRPSIDRLFRRFDEVGMRRSAAVFVESEELRREVTDAGVSAECVVLDPVAVSDADYASSVKRHVLVYMELMKDHLDELRARTGASSCRLRAGTLLRAGPGRTHDALSIRGAPVGQSSSRGKPRVGARRKARRASRLGPNRIRSSQGASVTETIRFGTDGWRALIAEDFTFANLRRIADAAGRVFAEDNPGGTILVGYDTRFEAATFAAEASAVLAAHGLRVRCSDRMLPTPALSWADRSQRRRRRGHAYRQPQPVGVPRLQAEDGRRRQRAAFVHQARRGCASRRGPRSLGRNVRDGRPARPTT